MVKPADPWLDGKREEFGRHMLGLHSTPPPKLRRDETTGDRSWHGDLLEPMTTGGS